MTPMEWFFTVALILLGFGAGTVFFILVIAFKMMRQHLEKHQ